MKLTPTQKRLRASPLFRALEKLARWHKNGAHLDYETALADIAGDLRHVADKLGCDWDEILRRADNYYNEEIAQ
jgi:hypothetical protein